MSNIEIRKDMLGNTPKIGDIVCWNPPIYKGLVYGKVVGFRKESGLPLVEISSDFEGKAVHGQSAGARTYVPKTGFIIVKIKDYETT